MIALLAGTVFWAFTLWATVTVWPEMFRDLWPWEIPHFPRIAKLLWHPSAHIPSLLLLVASVANEFLRLRSRMRAMLHVILLGASALFSVLCWFVNLRVVFNLQIHSISHNYDWENWKVFWIF
ncbi:MAG: hypothetical protein JXR37_23745 [Kiritimatiellae bacterium]|nr:hypothetical protein [Kiritimatiellia bacterium]